MDEWHVGDSADWGDSVGVPDIPYMGYLQDNDDEDDEVPHAVAEGNSLRDRAWDLRNAGNLNYALNTINEALEWDGNWRNYNVKAIILEDMNRLDEALSCYDMALAQTNDPVVKDNKARLLSSIARYRTTDNQEALDLINQALKLISNDDDRCSFLHVKRSILESMGRKRDAYVCNKLANRQPERVDEFEKQSEILKRITDTLICISATSFYDNFSPFKKGVTIDLVKEPENEHDSNAIRVEVNGKTVGYVANSSYTLIDEVSSATDIKNKFEDRTKAKVLFIYMERYVIAKLLS